MWSSCMTALKTANTQSARSKALSDLCHESQGAHKASKFSLGLLPVCTDTCKAVDMRIMHARLFLIIRLA